MGPKEPETLTTLMGGVTVFTVPPRGHPEEGPAREVWGEAGP